MNVIIEPDPKPPEINAASASAPINQFGALCIRPNGVGGVEVLLITTRETKRWTIPKGWPIKGLKPHKVAEREAWEEAGVEGRVRRRAAGSFDYVKKLAGDVLVPATVEVHVIDVKRCRKQFPERKQRTRGWFSPAEAARLVGEPGLQRLIRKLETHP